MRQQMIECRSRSTATRRCPWAAVVAKVDGGFIAFESAADYQAWRSQR